MRCRRSALAPDGITSAHLGYITFGTTEHLRLNMNHRPTSATRTAHSFEWDIDKVNYTPKQTKPTTPVHFRPLVVAHHLKILYDMMLMTMMEDQAEHRLQA